MHAHVCERRAANIPRTEQQRVNTCLGMRKDGSRTVTDQIIAQHLCCLLGLSSNKKKAMQISDLRKVQ